ncbi:MAG: ATP-binding cassette domain-containing protein [Filomicrobium sp.]
MIEIDIKKRQGRLKLDVCFNHPATGVLGLVGPSGAGKSTLLSCIAGLSRPDVGLIRLSGRTLFDSKSSINLPAADRKIGVVFQDGLLFPHMSVEANLLYAVKGVRPSNFADVVSALSLGGLLERRTNRLSGGERQRVAIGRALFSRPRLMILDEPVSALDPDLKRDVLDHLLRVVEMTAIPMIYISHAPEEIRKVANAVVKIRDGHCVPVGCFPAPLTETAADAAQLPGIPSLATGES